MSINTRIRWSNDGSQGYTFDPASAPGKTTITSAQRNFLDSDNTSANVIDWAGGFLIQFAAPVNLTALKIRMLNWYNIITRDHYITASSDSVDGFDGSWASLATFTLNADTQDILTTVSASMNNVKWLKITGIWSYNQIKELQIDGEYYTPRFRFFHIDGLTEYTNEYPLAFPQASNVDDYHEYLSFKVKNVDAVSHDYSITVYAIRYPSETWITNHFTLSLDSGANKLTTVSVSGISAGGLTAEIRVYADILIADNPTDGWHYFAIGVHETA